MTEDKVEQNALEILASLGWQVLHGPEIGNGMRLGGTIHL
jgi:hypothetical protein